MGLHCWKYESYFTRSSALILQSPKNIISIFTFILLLFSYLPYIKPFCYLIIKINSNKNKEEYSYVNIYNKCKVDRSLLGSRSNFLDRQRKRKRKEKINNNRSPCNKTAYTFKKGRRDTMRWDKKEKNKTIGSINHWYVGGKCV